MRTGGAYEQSNKQNLNTNISTEAKRVGVGDILTQVIWTQCFLKDQGYEIHEYVLYQDNQSAIKLEMNGGQSSRNITRHINIRYYFITDRIMSHFGNYRGLFHKGTAGISISSLSSYHYWYPRIWNSILWCVWETIYWRVRDKNREGKIRGS